MNYFSQRTRATSTSIVGSLKESGGPLQSWECIKTRRVEEYYSKEKKDDSNFKRGCKMVPYFHGSENPITIGDESNLYERNHIKVLEC
jgi:hypothetical protein